MSVSAERVFGDRVRAERQRKGWSLEDMRHQLAAVGVDWHRATINKIENGRRGVSLSDALVLARVLGVTIARLLDGHVRIGDGTLTPLETADLLREPYSDEVAQIMADAKYHGELSREVTLDVFAQHVPPSVYAQWRVERLAEIAERANQVERERAEIARERAEIARERAELERAELGDTTHERSEH